MLAAGRSEQMEYSTYIYTNIVLGQQGYYSLYLSNKLDMKIEFSSFNVSRCPKENFVRAGE